MDTMDVIGPEISVPRSSQIYETGIADVCFCSDTITQIYWLKSETSYLDIFRNLVIKISTTFKLLENFYQAIFLLMTYGLLFTYNYKILSYIKLYKNRYFC